MSFLTVFIQHMPAILSESARSPRGLFALAACLLAMVAWKLFGDSADRVKLGVFTMMFGGVVVFGSAILRSTEDRQRLPEHEVPDGEVKNAEPI